MSTRPIATTFINEDPRVHISGTPSWDPNNPGVRIKNKPGRKPNPATPNLRKVANRLAQRAFRERREVRLHDLEEEVENLKMQRDRANAALEACRVESGYLRNLVAMMQSIMIQNGISAQEIFDARERQGSPLNGNVSSESGHESDSSSIDITLMRDSTTPIWRPDAQSRFDNVSMQYRELGSRAVSPEAKFPLQAGILQATMEPPKPSLESMIVDQVDSPNPSFMWDDFLTTKVDESIHPSNNSGTIALATVPRTQNPIDGIFTPNSSDYPKSPTIPANSTQVDPLLPIPTSAEFSSTKYQNPILPSSFLSQSDLPSIFPPIGSNPPILPPAPVPMSTRAAIQLIQMRLRVQRYIKASNVNFSIQPTPLQLAVPHDPRIDLLPSVHIRERMIVFRGAFDLEACVDMLTDRAIFHGGDPSEPGNWELPEEFFDEFWFCCVHSDVERTNKWRRLRGLPDVKLKPPPVASLRKFGKYGEVQYNHIVDDMLQESMDALSMS